MSSQPLSERFEVWLSKVSIASVYFKVNKYAPHPVLVITATIFDECTPKGFIPV